MTESTETEATLVGTVLAGRYRIERLLGSGGMGAVYRAEHVLMRKACAVKVLHREMTQVKEVVARFEREAVAAARIEHPNVAAATDFGQLDDGSFYLVLEFLEGKSLNQQITEGGAMAEERALLITRQIADALAAAHGAGIIHRDLKPDNVMLVVKDGASDFVKVLDFGIAKVNIEKDPNVSQQALTRLNTVMGTPEYMSPEQARGEEVDHRADLYTVGIILYEMLAGTSPFRHEELVVILTKKLTEDPPPLPAHVSQGTRDLVGNLLQRAPQDRLPSAAEVVRQVDAILGYSPSPTSVAFAPVSGKSAPMLNVTPAQVAYANTVLGQTVAAASASESPWVQNAKTLLGQGVTLAKRRVTIRGKQLPLGAIFGVIFALPVLLALILSAGSGASSDAGSAAGSAAAAAPVDDDLGDLMKRAEGGDPTALAELLGRADEAKLAPAYRALGRGYFKLSKLDAGLRAYRAGGKLDPKLGDSQEVLADLRLASADPTNQPLSLEVATDLGAGGADFLYDLWDSNKTGNAPLSKQAKVLLDGEKVLQQASPALKVALELPKAKTEGCAAVKKLLPRVQESGDARVLPLLTRLADRRGCGFLGLRDCFGCLRAGKDLANAQKAVAERPSPKTGS